MSGKREVLELLDRLPDNVSAEDVLDHLYVYVQIQRGRIAADAGDTIPHEEVVEEFRQKWLRRTG